MAYVRTQPNDDTKVKAADDALRDNFDALEEAINKEHVFAGDGGADEGKHSPGLTGVIYVGPAASCAALASKEGSGALCYDTDNNQFKVWNGSDWDDYDFMKVAGDTLEVAWTVSGSFIDGRDPSDDGWKLDQCSVGGSYVEVAVIDEASSGEIIPPIDGFTKAECKVFIHNCGKWELTGSNKVKALKCYTVDPSPDPDVGFEIVSKLWYGEQGNANRTLLEVPCYGIIIGITWVP